MTAPQEDLQQRYAHWGETISQIAGGELAQMEDTWRKSMRVIIDMSGIASREGIEGIGQRFYRDLEGALRIASEKDRIILGKLEDAQQAANPLLRDAVLNTGNFLIKIQSEPRLSDMPPAFMRSYIAGRVRSVYEQLTPPQRMR